MIMVEIVNQSHLISLLMKPDLSRDKYIDKNIKDNGK